METVTICIMLIFTIAAATIPAAYGDQRITLVDSAAIEVTLNLDNVAYNLTILRQYDFIYMINHNTYFYNSRSINDVYIILIERSIGERKYLSIRVQSSVEYKRLLEWVAVIAWHGKLNLEKQLLESKGWRVLNGDNTLVVDREDVSIYIDRTRDGYILRIHIYSEDVDAYKDDVNSLLALLSINTTFDYEKVEKVKIVPKHSINEIRDVLKNEVRWLVQIGVISGLNLKVFEKCVEIADFGDVEDRRLVYVNGNWVHYKESISLEEGGNVILTFLPLLTGLLAALAAVLVFKKKY